MAAQGIAPQIPMTVEVSWLVTEMNGFHFSVFTSSANHLVTIYALQMEVDAVLEENTPAVVEMLH